MKSDKNFKFLFLVLFLLSVIQDVSNSEGRMISEINLSDKKLTANIENVLLTSVLEKLEQETGIGYWCSNDQAIDVFVSVKFTSLPVDKAIRRILGKTCHVIYYGINGMPLKIGIYELNGMSDKHNERLHKRNELISLEGKLDLQLENIAFTKNVADMEHSGARETKEHSERKERIVENTGITLNNSSTEVTPKGVIVNSMKKNVVLEGIKINSALPGEIPEGIKINSALPGEIPEGIKINSTLSGQIPGGIEINSAPPGEIPDGIVIHNTTISETLEGVTTSNGSN